MNPAKVLFLDIDGVLNSRRTCEAFDGFPHCYEPAHMARFDHVAIALIRRLCDKTGASIVLSSSWRHDPCKDTKIVAVKHATGLDLPIIDCTPDCNGPRGLEINAWLSAHQEVTSYAIVDDNDDMLTEQKHRFVQTNFETGLSLQDYLTLEHLLGPRAQMETACQ